MIKYSLVHKWFNRKGDDSDILESSVFMNKLFNGISRKASLLSFSFKKSVFSRILKELYVEFRRVPVKIISLFVLTGVLTNLVFSIFSEMDVFWVFFRILIVILCLIGLRVNISLSSLKRSYILKNIYQKI